MDALLISVAIPNTIVALITAPLTNALIPEYTHYYSKKLLNCAASSLFLKSCPYLILLSLFGFWLQYLVSLDQSIANPTAAIVIWSSFPIVISSLIFTSALQVKAKFIKVGLTVFIPSLFSFFSCLIFHEKLGIESGLIGQCVGALFVLIYLLKTELKTPSKQINIASNVMRSLPMGFAAIVLFILYPVSDAFWGQRIGISATSHLAYAQKIIVGTSVAIIAGYNVISFQKIAEDNYFGKKAEAKFYLTSTIIAVFKLIFPAAIIIGLTIELIITVILSPDPRRVVDVVQISKVVRTMLPGMVFMSMTGFLFNAMYSTRSLSYAGFISTASATTYFLLSGLLKEYFGAYGVGISYSITWVLAFLLSLARVYGLQSLKEKANSLNLVHIEMALKAITAGAVSIILSRSVMVEAAKLYWSAFTSILVVTFVVGSVFILTNLICKKFKR